ncbi:alkane 1-monooxygenase [Mycolicibacterium madagascariense]|uniref:Alkane 1-monooxygenase n=1 Tax=Mycolicibacterium madagascariense TaxID=212765 RepID=A0A7I7XCC2_9MYCO|nr:alkane 1-monooxygenase [Mycolicibacterium madagascariense]MCV7015677.1 alkane 1-monooxygenase [Mycolicibacterium madagascariense]BBZ27092.1 alkane 1-monooxygenase [Mycolicibacterium madagascariense]
MPNGRLRTSPNHDLITTPRWRDPKRHLWLFGLVAPTVFLFSWIGFHLTGFGIFWWSGPLLTFVIIPVLDYLVGRDSENPPDSALAQLEDDRFYRWATYLYLPIQYVSLALACWLWTGGGWVTLNRVDEIGLMITIGGIGGIAVNAAHELGHQRAKAEQRLSKLALAQVGYGHFFVAHNRGHHILVATPEDPASSRMGENLYAFIVRSSVGNVRTAWRLERQRLARLDRSVWSPRNDVLNAWAMTLVLFAALVAAFGLHVLPWLIGQAVVGVCLMEAINFLEHYGLRRQRRPNGRYERVRPSHSWNNNTVVANLILFHLQRHSDHHAHPSRRYQALRHDDEAPQLPAGYSTMLLLAGIPPLWRRVMDPLVLAHYGGDIRLVAMHPRSEKRLLDRHAPVA